MSSADPNSRPSSPSRSMSSSGRRKSNADTVGSNTTGRHKKSSTLPQSAVEESLRTFRLLEALRAGDHNAIKSLVQSVSPSAEPGRHTLPLHLAIQCADTPTVSYLISLDAVDINEVDAQGNTPLHVSAKAGRADVVALLLQAEGTNDTIVNNDGRTPIDLVPPGTDTWQMLEEHRNAYILSNTLLLHTYAREKNFIALQTLLSAPRSIGSPLPQGGTSGLLNINHQDATNGSTILHEAAKSHNYEMVEWALANGADPLLRDRNRKLPIDLTDKKDDRIRGLFKKAAPNVNIASTAPGQMPKMQGYIQKWTNYAGGFKSRWFVLEDGNLSYFKSQDDASTASRGSINLKYTKLWIDSSHSSEKTRFDIIGTKTSTRYHLKAGSVQEAKRWIFAITQAKQFLTDVERGHHPTTSVSSTGNKRLSFLRDGQGDSIRESIDLAPLMEDSSSTHSGPNNNLYHDDHPEDHHHNRVGDAVDSLGDEDDDSLDEENVAPSKSHYLRTVNNVRSQIDVQEQLLESLLTVQQAQSSTQPPIAESSSAPASPLIAGQQAAKQAALVGAFRQSLNSLRGLLDDMVQVGDEAQTFWQKKYAQEAGRRRLWEESMRSLAIEQQEMEVFVKSVVNDRKKSMRKKTKDILREPSISAILQNEGEGTTATGEGKTMVTKDESVLNDNKKITMEPEEDIMADDEGEEEFFDAIGEGEGEGSQIVLEPTVIPDRSDSETISTIATTGTETTSTDLTSPLHTDIVRHNPVAVSYHGYKKHPLRTHLPLAASKKPEISLWSILKNSIGKDLTKISLPVFFNEPSSMLQRMCEDMEYAELLDKAVKQPGSTERMLYVAAFAMSNFSSVVGRVAKPFNPLLGETFEYVRVDKEYRYISEQVSHHPPISACYCESPHYVFYAESDVKSRFWGKSFEIMPKGNSHVELRVPNRFIANSNKSDLEGITTEHYSWKKVTTMVQNLIVGTPYIEMVGDMIFTNHRTGDSATLTFKPRGWRGAYTYEVRGYIENSDGEKIWELAGRWNDRILARRVQKGATEEDLGNADLEDQAIDSEVPVVTSAPSSQKKKKSEIYLIWKRHPFPDPPAPFNLTDFAVTLNDLPDVLKPYLAPTDCRFRPDQRAMEDGRYDEASNLKTRLEEKQRTKRREREANPNYEHQPRWFRKSVERDTHEEFWEFTGEYWDVRERVRSEWEDEGKPREEVSWNIEDDDLF